MRIAFSQCVECRHYLEDHRCSAFEHIPVEIFLGEHDHREPYEGDNGIRFEPLEGSNDHDADA